MTRRVHSDAIRLIAGIWVDCPDGCGVVFCVLHELHANECPCPPLDVWADNDVFPYWNGEGDDA